MMPTDFRAPAQALQATADQTVAGPVLLDPAMFKLVSGGLPKGGWEVDPIIIEHNPSTPPTGCP